MLPAFCTKLLLMLSVPIELPGATIPPVLIVVAPRVPLPASVPPLFTVKAAFDMFPFTLRVPPLTAKLETVVLVPVSVHWLVPSFWNVSNP